MIGRIRSRPGLGAATAKAISAAAPHHPPSAAAAAHGRRRWASTSSSTAGMDRVDPREVEKFGNAAAEWWDPKNTTGAGMLHALNPIRVQYIVDRVAPRISSHAEGGGGGGGGRDLTGMRAVDIGCGGGLLSESLARLGASVVGVDPTLKAIEAARTHAAIDPLTASIEYRNTVVEELVAAGESFDLVCGLEVVEHTTDPDEFVANCAALVRPGGALVMSTINRNTKSYLMAIAGAEYAAGLIPPGTHEWERFRTPAEMSGAMARAGLAVAAPTGIVFHPHLLLPVTSAAAWGLSDFDTDVNYILHAVRGL